MISKDELAVVSRSSRPATATCYRLALRSLRAAEIQVARIWDRNLTVGSAERIDSLAQDVLIDVHFYFIALRGLYRFLEKIVNDPNFAYLQLQLEALNQRWFKHYAAGREAFEHIDQRLPGEKHEHRLVEVEKGGAKHKTQYG